MMVAKPMNACVRAGGPRSRPPDGRPRPLKYAKVNRMSDRDEAWWIISEGINATLFMFLASRADGENAQIE